jgi:NMD protein affecting ribosome stability and mRNA decay
LGATTVSIWFPMFILFYIIMIQQAAARKLVVMMVKKRKGRIAMTNELINKYVGKYCYITTGTMGVSVKGTILEVNENWLEVQTNRGIEVLNLDFIQNIKLK